jgi:hypothetical protein
VRIWEHAFECTFPHTPSRVRFGSVRSPHVPSYCDSPTPKNTGIFSCLGSGTYGRCTNVVAAHTQKAMPQWRLAAVVVAACAASAHATEIVSVRIARHGAETNLVFGDCSSAMKWALTPVQAAAAQTVASVPGQAVMVLIKMNGPVDTRGGPAPLCVSGTSALSLAPCNESDAMQQ